MKRHDKSDTIWPDAKGVRAFFCGLIGFLFRCFVQHTFHGLLDAENGVKTHCGRLKRAESAKDIPLLCVVTAQEKVLPKNRLEHSVPATGINSISRSGKSS